jgi:hypothetical protein
VNGQAAQVLAEARRRDPIAFPLYLRRLHPKQRAFVLDKSRRKAAHPGRRAGKTAAIAVMLVHAILGKPDVMACFVGLTRRVARRLIWKPLKELNRKFGLGLDFSESELIVKATNGSEIYLFGAETEDDLEKLRGSPWVLVAIDEAGSFRSFLKYLVEEVIEPALMDHRGTLVLSGTPNASKSGYFADICTGENPDVRRWEAVHHWTMLDNRYLSDPKGWLESDVLQKRGWTWDHSVVRREYMGEWVRDSQLLVYRYDKPANDVDELPVGEWRFILGVDLGASRKEKTTALSLWAFSPTDKRAWCLKSWKLSLEDDDAGPSDLADEILKVNANHPLASVVVDTGGLGAGYAREFRKRYLPVEAAEKSEKRVYIAMMNEDFKKGLIRIVRHANQDYVEELKNLQWDPDTDPERPEEDTDRSPNHLCDAGLYAWRKCRHYRAKEPAAPEPKLTPEEETRREAERMRNSILKSQRRAAAGGRR